MAETISCPRCHADVVPEGDGDRARFPAHVWPRGVHPTVCGASGWLIEDVGPNGRIRGDVSAHQGPGPA